MKPQDLSKTEVFTPGTKPKNSASDLSKTVDPVTNKTGAINEGAVKSSDVTVSKSQDVNGGNAAGQKKSGSESQGAATSDKKAASLAKSGARPSLTVSALDEQIQHEKKELRAKEKRIQELGVKVNLLKRRNATSVKQNRLARYAMIFILLVLLLQVISMRRFDARRVQPHQEAIFDHPAVREETLEKVRNVEFVGDAAKLKADIGKIDKKF